MSDIEIKPGQIWKSNYGHLDLTVKILEVHDGRVVYSFFNSTRVNSDPIVVFKVMYSILAQDAHI